MPKQTVTINFSQGLDTKTDEKQVSLGKFLALKNSVFTKGGLLQKRNGYKKLPSLPGYASYATTFNGGLTAVGSSIQALPTNAPAWIKKGEFQPLELSTLPLIRNNLNQTQADSTIAPNGYICTAFTETNGTDSFYKYVIADSVTGQNIIAPTLIPNADADYGTPRIFQLGLYFVIVYTAKVAAVYRLVYIAISVNNPSLVSAETVISTSYTPSTTVAFDGAVFNNALYLAWNGASSSGIKMAYLTAALGLSAVSIKDASHEATLVSVCSDQDNAMIWVSYYDSGTDDGYTLAVNPILALVSGFPVQIISSVDVANLASAAQNGVNTIFYETNHMADSVDANFVSSVTVIQSTAVVSSPIVVIRSLGLGSKAFINNGVLYFLGAYQSTFQPTYFLVNGSISTSASPQVIAKLAYENGGGYLVTGLPSISQSGTEFSVAYLFKDLVEAISNTNEQGTVTQGGIYSQTGINLVKFNLSPEEIVSAEIGANLNISGGFLWAYDGYSLAEQGFHLWPETIQLTHSSSDGLLTAQEYVYVVTYEWTDNQGNAFRSAGSIPIHVTTTGSTSSVVLTIPTLRVTAKIANPVKIVVYRWSAAQEIFYQTTSITSPLLNDPTADNVTFTDIHADSSIAGNNILYTTGGVVEDIGPPATAAITLFDNRLWLVDSEDRNLLWFSKQVIEATPVEMSDLLTLYVAPSIGATGPTGPISAISTMDDKLVIFKHSGMLYINGQGPDSTGANNAYSQPTFITSMIGCSNQNSIVFQPEGLMFEFASEAGNQIWILTRGLGTEYIGAPVEELTKNATVVSALAIPGTNQVRFNLSSGITLMYDYYYNQWGSFSNSGISSTLYQDLHTYIDKYGEVFQETPGLYLDGSNPVLLSFTTSWINIASLQGFERFYYFYLLGTYFSPHKLNIELSYNYVHSVLQTDLITPDNFSSAIPSAFGDQPAPFGSPIDVEQWRIHAQEQKCTAFQISIQEVYDPSLGAAPGAGLNLSGLNMVVMAKRGTRPIRAANQAG